MAVNKIMSELQTQMNVMANQEPIAIIVRHKEGFFSPHTVLPDSPNIDHKFKLFPGEAIKVTAADIEALSKQEDVEQIWPDLPVHTCLNVSVPHIQAPQVWGKGIKGTGIKVAVVDTGIDAAHPDFTGRIMATANFVGADNSAHDDNGHGTHVAGIVAGSGAGANGKYVGVAPEANLYVAKVLDARGGGSMSGVMAGIEWAVLDQRVQVINLSLGGSTNCDGTDALSTLCDEAVRQADVVMCVAAGNAGPGSQTIGSPGCARYAITVGAIDDSERMADFSSRGPTADGRVKPDIVYPGVGIVAAQSAGTTLGPVVEEGYVSCNGTSMATPHAAGVAALMLQAKPTLTAEQVKTKMLFGAVDIGALPNEQGVGRGDASQAYEAAIKDDPQITPAPSEPQGCLASLFGKR